jgi:ribosomal protein S18 acetylase RimI-like enzyme
MTASDLDAVERIAGLVHPNFFERREVLAEKQRLYPVGSWVYTTGDEVLGYFLTHPWHTDAIPTLDGMLSAIPKGGTYYFHDLALLPEARRTGAAGTAVGTALAHAVKAGYRTATLVAVNNSIEFWGRQGFAVVDVPHLADKLRAYEPGARLMRRAL